VSRIPSAQENYRRCGEDSGESEEETRLCPLEPRIAVRRLVSEAFEDAVLGEAREKGSLPCSWTRLSRPPPTVDEHKGGSHGARIRQLTLALPRNDISAAIDVVMGEQPRALGHPEVVRRHI
jgi:hypothetical protein